jgi:hypothetical protein
MNDHPSSGDEAMRTRLQTDQRGIALVVVMLLTVAVTALVAGAIYLTGTAKSIAQGQEREEEMRNAADAGIELGRSALNGTSVTLDTVYQALYTNQVVNDANGVPIPNVTRSVYYGPTGSSTGQYGIFASIVSIITDPSGAVVVRRGELAQESFAKFAYYSDSEGSGICFGGNDQIFGPLHSNANVCIYSSLAHFHNTFDVSGLITGKAYGTFDLGYTENGSIIPLPTVTALSKLATYATQGGMNYTAPAGGAKAQPRMRIEFVALDLDGDGRVTGPDEGFYRMYQNTGAVNTDYVSARRIATPANSLNCGHYHNATFFTAAQHQLGGAASLWVAPWNNVGGAPPASRTHVGAAAPGATAANEALSLNTSGGAYRCWLGGDDHLNITSVVPAGGAQVPRNTFQATDPQGGWIQYTNAPDPAVIAGLKNTASLTVDTTLDSRNIQAQYLWPLSRNYNPNSKGVIYVNGRVGISGVLNGRVTIASNADITVLDDLRYAITPGSAPCLSSNIMGLIANDTIYMSNNTLNAPWSYLAGASDGLSGGTYRTYDDSGDETLHGVLLTLRSFYNESHGTGSTTAQPCGAAAWGRGCLYLTGGIIQGTRGAVGTGGGTGYTKAYSYDVCAFQTPPPYFPTTGRYLRNRYYEIDPVGFNVAAFYLSLAPTF